MPSNSDSIGVVRNTVAMNGGSNMTKGDYIPDDIISDVLTWLSSKSVSRFRIACKTWDSLISDPVFINLHSKRASLNPKILLSLADSQFQLLDYESSSFDNSCLSGPLKFPGKIHKIIGSSRGLVCVATESCGDSFCIWNPLNGECRKIPKPSYPLKSLRYLDFDYYYHGFGYDSVGNDFKLVILLNGTIKANIFSLKSNLWKQIIASPLAIHDAVLIAQTHATFLNGILYWIVLPKDDVCEIVAFDVAKETFEKLPLQLPAFWELGDVVNLLVHRGCLCFSFSKHSSFHNDIWMMKEKSWVHLLTIKNSSPFDDYRVPILFLCISKRNQVVFHTPGKFSRCESKEEDKFKLDIIRIPKPPYAYGANLYVETLVSPNCL